MRLGSAHGGIITGERLRGWLGSLESLLSETEQALGSAFEDVELVRADTGRFRGGIHEYPRAERLRGPNDVFEEFEVRTRVALDSDHLAFVSRGAGPGEVLTLVPLVRLGPATSTSKNACYFFDSSVTPGSFAYVSYHFEDQPRIELQDGELRRLALELAVREG